MAINISTDIAITTGGKLYDITAIQGGWQTVQAESDMFALTGSAILKAKLTDGQIFYVESTNELYKLNITGTFPLVNYNFDSFSWPGSGGGGGDTSALNTFSGSIQLEVDSLTNFTGSIQLEVDNLNSFSGSIQSEVDSITNFTGSIQNEVDTLTAATGSYLVGSDTGSFVTNDQTGSFAVLTTNTFTGNQNIEGDLNVDGDIFANRYVVSSSVTFLTQSFSSGSTIFGDTLDDTHLFTGSVNITGSFFLNDKTIVEEVGVIFRQTGSYFSATSPIKITGSLGVELDGSSETFDVSVSGEKKFTVNDEGVVVLGAFSSPPTAVSGGFYYSSGNEFFVGM